MTVVQSCVMLAIGVVALIAGLLGRSSDAKEHSKAFGTGMIILMILGVVLVVSAVIHVSVEDKSNEASIQEVLDDDVIKTIQLYNNGSVYRQYDDVIKVEMANDNVVAFITSDGMTHAIRPGTDAVVVTEAKK